MMSDSKTSVAVPAPRLVCDIDLVQCVSSNPMVTVDFTEPIVSSGSAGGYLQDVLYVNLSGDVSDDQMSVTIDMGNLDPIYSDAGGYYYWTMYVGLDNCDTSYTWSDNFFELSYVDDEQNIIDLSGFENPYIYDPDTGTCGEYG